MDQKTILGIAAATILVAFGVNAVDAQISYVAADNQGNGHLRLINGDGTGDAAMDVPFASIRLPTWSRDGTVVMLTAIDPSPTTPGQHSTNIFAYTPATGGVARYTSYEDQFDPNSPTFSYTFPDYKALSPDGNQLAVFSLVQTRGNGNDSDLPVLQIYSPIGQVNPTLVLVDSQRDGTNGGHHGGEGVDWSPKQNVLVAPLATMAPYQNGSGSSGEITALFLVAPVQSAKQTGQIQRITSPQTDFNINNGTVYAEHDYMPKFSPNGTGIAFVRSFQSSNLSSSATPNPDVQSLHILNLNTGADTQLAQFPRNVYITSLDWSPDGTALVFDLGLQRSGPTGPQQQADPGTDQVYVINTDGSGLHQLLGNGAGQPSWKPLAKPTVLPNTLANISSRVLVLGGDNTLIGGFIVTGSEPKKVIVRAIGPSLAQSGVAGPLSDPVLELHGGDGGLLARNDNWKDTQQADIQATGIAPKSDLESAIVLTLSPGSYTAIVTGKNGSTGTGVVEAYDLTQSVNSKLANIATRAFVGTGDTVLIGGFIAGPDTQTVIRAIGPTLSKNGISNPLLDPTLELHNGNGDVVAANDNWRDSQEAELRASGLQPNDDREAALIKTLAFGNYTAVIRGNGGTSGVGLMEVYNLH